MAALLNTALEYQVQFSLISNEDQVPSVVLTYIFFSLNFMHFVSVAVLNLFLFPLRLQIYHLSMANVPPAVHVPQVGNPCARQPEHSVQI